LESASAVTQYVRSDVAMNERRHLQSSGNYSATFCNIKKLRVLPYAKDKT